MRLQPDAQRRTFQRPPGLLPEMGLRAAIAAAATFPKRLIIAPAPRNKERAMAMYREGSSLRAIGRVFGVSAQAVSV